MGIEKIQNELRAAAKKEKIKIYQNFHKTSNDGYAQGEIFLGVTVPDIRKVALSNLNISDEEIIKLLATINHDEKTLVDFLAKRYKKMPRTMLRYAIEKFDAETRKKYLNGEL